MNTTRITLTIDDDVADALKERARALNQTFEQVVNDALRRDVLNGAVGDKPRPKFRVKPFHSEFMPGIGKMEPNKLNDELMVQDFLEKKRRSGIEIGNRFGLKLPLRARKSF